MQPDTRIHRAEAVINPSEESIAKEYEEFAYIVSHDLNAPLRHIREFTRLLLDARNGHPTQDEQEYKRLLEKSLQRIDDMQKALLTFSRINTSGGAPRKTDLNHSVANALKLLADRIQACGALVECGNLPCVYADQRQMELLFFHLIDNALKFHEESTDRRLVAISAYNLGSAWLFEVKDNGIGIAEQHHNDIFKMFRRLEPEKYTGTGAGLTLAKKIVQRHGGQIKIESEAGLGTSVFFTLG